MAPFHNELQNMNKWVIRFDNNDNEYKSVWMTNLTGKQVMLYTGCLLVEKWSVFRKFGIDLWDFV